MNVISAKKIGMYSQYNLVNQKLNGSIVCESEVNHGVQFYFETPKYYHNQCRKLISYCHNIKYFLHKNTLYNTV